MTWLLVQGKADAPSGRQWTFDTPVQGQWQVFSDPPPTYANLTPTLQKLAPPLLAPAPWATWIFAMLGALLGGILLNLMPCVFPVLAIKLLSITQMANRPRDMKLSAWAFTAGVLISFLVLGALMLALRAAGSQMGWGFQLQSPWVVGALAMLFAVIGLNLSGMFEFRSCQVQLRAFSGPTPLPIRYGRVYLRWSLPHPARRRLWEPPWAWPLVCRLGRPCPFFWPWALAWHCLSWPFLSIRPG
jgi:hypothetical protein